MSLTLAQHGIISRSWVRHFTTKCSRHCQVVAFAKRHRRSQDAQKQEEVDGWTFFSVDTFLALL
jgi:hypothetical protein